MNTMCEKSFRRSITALDAVFAFIVDFVSEYGIASETAFALQLAIEEVFTNLVKYDVQADPVITIRLSKDKDRIVAKIINTGGEYFDMTSVQTLESPPNPLEGRGLGLYLVGKMVDDFHYEYADGTGIITISASMEE